MSEPRIAKRDVEAATRSTEEAAPEVCALALDVLSRQGEAQLLFAGKDYVRARAEQHGVDEDVEVAGETLVPVLERGPATTKEHALVCALAVRGLRSHLDDEERLTRFLRHADWLTFSTPYAVYEFVAPVLGDDAAAVWRVLADAEAPEGPRGAAIRALREAVLPSSVERPNAGSSEELCIAGRVGRWPPSGTRGLLRLVSGWALLQWLGRLLAWAVGVRRKGELSLVKGGIRLGRETQVLGKTAIEGGETFTLAAVASAGRTTRYPTLHLLAGTLAFAIGVIIGGVFLFDGLRSGETVLLFIGAGLVLAGGGLDLALSVLVPGKRGEVSIDLAVLPKRRVRITGVAEAEAEAFLKELRFRMEERAR